MSSVHAGLLWHVPRARHVSPLSAFTPHPCTSRSCFAKRSSACQVCMCAGVVLEAFGVGNMPDANSHGWLPWLQRQTKQGVKVRGARGPCAPCQTRACACSWPNRLLMRLSVCWPALQVYLASQCSTGPLHPELYRRCWHMVKIGS